MAFGIKNPLDYRPRIRGGYYIKPRSFNICPGCERQHSGLAPMIFKGHWHADEGEAITFPHQILLCANCYRMARGSSKKPMCSFWELRQKRGALVFDEDSYFWLAIPENIPRFGDYVDQDFVVSNYDFYKRYEEMRAFGQQTPVKQRSAGINPPVQKSPEQRPAVMDPAVIDEWDFMDFVAAPEPEPKPEPVQDPVVIEPPWPKDIIWKPYMDVDPDLWTSEQLSEWFDDGQPMYPCKFK